MVHAVHADRIIPRVVYSCQEPLMSSLVALERNSRMGLALAPASLSVISEQCTPNGNVAALGVHTASRLCQKCLSIQVAHALPNNGLRHCHAASAALGCCTQPHRNHHSQLPAASQTRPLLVWLTPSAAGLMPRMHWRRRSGAGLQSAVQCTAQGVAGRAAQGRALRPRCRWLRPGAGMNSAARWTRVRRRSTEVSSADQQVQHSVEAPWHAVKRMPRAEGQSTNVSGPRRMMGRWRKHAGPPCYHHHHTSCGTSTTRAFLCTS